MSSCLLRNAWLAPALLFCGSISQAALSDTLPKPTGPVILSITGAVEHTNAQGAANFDREMLEALGTTQLETGTVWTSGESMYEGVLASKVLEAAGASGDVISARALNDYAEEIPFSDFVDYPVLLALKTNGQYMRVRDKGPIWVMYPVKQYPELATMEIERRWVWQLRELQIK